MVQREAIVAVLRRADRVLAVRRGPTVSRPGFWQPLSGKVEPGETQEQALVREVMEEVGLTVSPGVKVWESETDDGHFRLHWWTADADSGEVVPDTVEVAEARWVTPEEFLALNPVFDGDREFFERILPDL
ncbi:MULTISPECIES: NUDIX domain-containing protein [unclassified Streptomyces]|uniref:NUDIX domain-containing protein n=1 Tax=unclassified Streptomyces TaxID=2593676 RepID=UPI002254A8D8|nr:MULTISPECIES: NUDIX domain-containing protein [unclassified Streptomyces]MCX5046850.1 NUDIX domain-containing protein [Streptomyces sp. NBC_00474]MCX5244669.1 NUDIX domain-containing protein [Streptomyces sp. NBC_00201]MCX5289599.1 NUDIX domain-containing protein [Streptomyces sp. NBC_00183]